MLPLLFSAAASPPAVRTSAGPVYGTALDGANQFLGLPFASSQRFEAPVDFTGKYPNGSLQATDFRPACMQIGTSASITYGSEDCLAVNIWQPAGASSGDKLPVLCFIFGGSWQFGETEPYNGSALAAKHNVVYAALAYRTGPIGFMAFEEDAAQHRTTGNWGMLDMLSGLRWLQREVEAFGGDPGRVTIHGQSSGGQAVELHHVMPGSRGLLSGIISESGGLSGRSLQAGLATGAAAATAAGCSSAEGGVKACMQKVPPLAITSQTYSLSFSPLIDGVTIPADPLVMLRRGEVNPGVGFIAGAQTNDSNRELFPKHMDRGTLKPLSAHDYRHAVQAMVGKRGLEQVLALYPSTWFKSAENVRSLGRIYSDRVMCGARRRLSWLMRANSRAGAAFLYRFDYYYRSNSKCTAEPNYHSAELGATHEDEVTFVMGQPTFMQDGSCCGVYGKHAGSAEACAAKEQCSACYAPRRFGTQGYRPYFNANELAFSELVGRYWTNFASSRDPNVRRDFDRRTGRFVETSTAPRSPPAVRWPDVSTAQNIVLNADFAGHAAAEGTLYDDGRVCTLWDELEEQAVRSTVEQAEA